MKKIHQIIAKCTIKYQFTQNKFVDISIVVQKYFKPQMYHFMIFNHMNKKRRDDIITIKSMTLPRGITEAEANPNAWALVFTQRLKILWHAHDAQNDKIHRMKDAFIDNSIIKEEVIQKVVEVRVYGDDYIQKKLEKKQQMKRQARNSSSDSDLSVDEEEYNLIKIDVKDVKAIIRMIRKKAAALEMGVRGWYKHFDKDDSDEIELNEFIKMIQFLKIKITDRLGIMLFRVFDRQNLGYFNYAQFSDILEKRLKPNYKMIVRMERARFALEGLNIKFPERKKKQKEVVYRDIVKEIPKEIIKEKVVEKKVAVDKIVEKKVVVEKPIYIEKIVEKPIYIEPKAKRQPSVKVVEKEVVIEKPVYVERTIQMPPPQEPVAQPRPVAEPEVIQPRPQPERPVQPSVKQPSPRTVTQPPEPSIPSSSVSNWDDQDNSSKTLKSECKGVFNVNEAVMMYEIFSGKDKDYYLTTSTKALH